MNNYDMQDYMHSPTDEDIEADSAGAFYKAGADAERSRIGGLFDAVKWENVSNVHRLIEFERTDEGLREKK
jgi:hypothetical protein